MLSVNGELIYNIINSAIIIHRHLVFLFVFFIFICNATRFSIIKKLSMANNINVILIKEG